MFTVNKELGTVTVTESDHLFFFSFLRKFQSFMLRMAKCNICNVNEQFNLKFRSPEKCVCLIIACLTLNAQFRDPGRPLFSGSQWGTSRVSERNQKNPDQCEILYTFFLGKASCKKKR